MSLDSVSVVIPVYNGQNFLERALESVYQQSHRPHQIIVVDDGSTDRTPEILARHVPRITTLRIPNSGPAAARNAGIGLASGDAIAFLDHDDRWFRQKLEKQVAAARKYPQAGVICCDFAVRHASLKNRMATHFALLKHPENLNFDEPLKMDAFKALAVEHFVGTTSTPLVRREVVEKVGGFNPEYRSSQDYDFWLRCALVTEFLLLSDVLMYKKNHPDNISQNPSRTYSFHYRVLANLMEREPDAIRERKLLPTFRRSLSETAYFLGHLHFNDGRYRQAFACYFDGFRVRPYPGNFARFLWIVSKKTVRLLTFGVISRDNLRRFYRGKPR